MSTDSPVLKFARFSLACLVAYWLLLALATHWPFAPSEADTPKIDKPLHQIAFALLALCACWAVGTRRRLNVRLAAVIAAVLLAYGAVDEFTQDLVPRRTPSVADWLADLLGVAVGMAAWWIAPQRWKAALGDRSAREAEAADSPASTVGGDQ